MKSITVKLCGVQRLCAILALTLFAPRGQAQAPVFEIAPVHSWIKFHVKSSVTLAGKFDKWDAGLTFKSPDETTGLLEIRIDAASVDTGSGTSSTEDGLGTGRVDHSITFGASENIAHFNLDFNFTQFLVGT